MSIWDLHNLDGSPRFYPPGAHPATAQLRDRLRTAEELRGSAMLALMDTGTIDALIAYLRQQLADFEARESEIKARLS